MKRPRTRADLVDELIYRSYEHNRKIAPNITPEEWRKLFGDAVDRLEERFQREAADV